MATTDERLAVMETKVDVLTKDVETLSKSVTELVAAMNRGRGAFGFAMTLSAAMGAVAALFLQWFKG
jgi:hypothetical protein